jgi:hypothetical protein
MNTGGSWLRPVPAKLCYLTYPEAVSGDVTQTRKMKWTR